MRTFDGQRALVVGAGSGIGREAALVLARSGVVVVCADVAPEGVDTLVPKLREDGHRASGAVVDLRDDASVQGCVDDVVGRLGGLDVVVNCAAVTGRTGVPTHEVEPADFDQVVAVNLRGAFLLSRAVLPAMREQGYGRLLHLASIAGKEGNPGMAAYSATKAGLIGLVKTMAKEAATQGVTVNALAPAVIRTPMVASLPAEQVTYMTERIPMNRTGTLGEVAAMIRWIVSPECSFTTGFTFDLSGGRATY